MSSSDSEDEVCRAALPVRPLPSNFQPSAAPTTAEEYLQHVMWEAKQCEEIKTVELDESRRAQHASLFRRQTKAVAPPDYLPSKDEQEDMLHRFKSAVKTVEHSRTLPKKEPTVVMPNSDEEWRWCLFCHGSKFLRSIAKEVEMDDLDVDSIPENVEAAKPLMSTLLNIDESMSQDLMEWSVSWLRAAGELTPHQGVWLYGLLSIMHKPLIPELCSNLRQLVYLCAKYRSRLESRTDPSFIHLNLVITVVSRYFDQKDLVDPY